ncbi:MAG: hypothetical protein ACI4LC_04880 [Emergencia sp.]
MNKKLILASAAILIALFSAGIFTRIALPSGSVLDSVSGYTCGGFFQDLVSYLKSDVLTVLAFFIFAQSTLLLPLNFLIIAYKAYVLGFTAAHLMTVQGLLVCSAMLLPRSLIKIPVYAYLLLVGFDTGRPQRYRRYLTCLGVLAASSLVEVILMQFVF